MPTLAAIFLSDHGWSIALTDPRQARRLDVVTPVDAPDPRNVDPRNASTLTATVTGQAQALRQLLNQQRAKRGAAMPVLSLPGEWCLAASITTDGLLRRRRREAMLYRLEEKLPLDAELFTADFIEHPGRALGVGVETAKVTPLLEALEQVEISVGPIVPLPLLALAALDERERGDADLLVLREDDRLNVLVLRRGLPLQWHQASATPAALSVAVRRHLLEASEPVKVLAVDLGEPLLDALRGIEGLNVPPPIERTVLELATQQSGRMAGGGREPMVNLRRGALAPRDRLQQVRRPLLAAMLSLLVLLSTIAGVSAWRSVRYEQLAEAHRMQLQELFRGSFPGQNVPGAVLARLQSEARQLEGVRGNDQRLPERVSALHLLHETLAGLPTELRYRVLEIRVDGRQLYLDGQTRSHSDANAIAAGLRHRGVFDLQPPRTEALRDRGVAFTLTATPAPGTPGSAPGTTPAPGTPGSSPAPGSSPTPSREGGAP